MIECEDCHELMADQRGPGAKKRFCEKCAKKRAAARSRARYHRDEEATRVYRRAYYREHRTEMIAATKRWEAKKPREEPPRYCAACGGPRPKYKSFCEPCGRARARECKVRNNHEHKEQQAQREQTEHWKEQHRRAARNYERRKRAKQKERIA